MQIAAWHLSTNDLVHPLERQTAELDKSHGCARDAKQGAGIRAARRSTGRSSGFSMESANRDRPRRRFRWTRKSRRLGSSELAEPYLVLYLCLCHLLGTFLVICCTTSSSNHPLERSTWPRVISLGRVWRSISKVPLSAERFSVLLIILVLS